MVAFIESGNTLTIHACGRPYNITSNNHPNYKKILDLLLAGSATDQEIVDLLDVSRAVVKASFGKLKVCEGEVLYKDEPVHGLVVDRILTLIGQGHKSGAMPLIKFLEKLMRNPSYNARQELYGFLQASQLPITEDGNFLAYKVVTGDYKDKHTRSFDNSVGAEVTMPRDKVDDNKQNTCSSGLHFCGYDYAREFFYRHGDRMVIVEIDPADVVSIPVDYDNKKGRCCRYRVVDEHPDTVNREFFNKNQVVVEAYEDDFSYYDDDYEEYCYIDVDYNGEPCWRDSNGDFVDFVKDDFRY